MHRGRSRFGGDVAGVIVVKVRGPDGKESEVTAPEGSKINVDDKGKVTVTLPPNAPKPAVAPAAKPADPAELECRLKAEGQVQVTGLVVTPDGKRVIAGYAKWWAAGLGVGESEDHQHASIPATASSPRPSSRWQDRRRHFRGWQFIHLGQRNR